MNLSFSVQLSESKSNTFKLITSDIPYNSFVTEVPII